MSNHHNFPLIFLWCKRDNFELHTLSVISRQFYQMTYRDSLDAKRQSSELKSTSNISDCNFAVLIRHFATNKVVIAFKSEAMQWQCTFSLPANIECCLLVHFTFDLIQINNQLTTQAVSLTKFQLNSISITEWMKNVTAWNNWNDMSHITRKRVFVDFRTGKI